MNKTFFILIIFSSSLNAMKLYMPFYNQKKEDQTGYSKYRNLVVALENNDYRLCKHLLEKIGVSPDAPDIPNKGPLEPPIQYAKTIPLARLLIANGAHVPSDIHDYDYTDDSYPCELLHFYLKNDFISAEDALLHGLVRSPASRKHESTEMLANRIAKIWLLLQYGTNPYKQCIIQLKNMHLNTALHHGALTNDSDFCKLLIEFETVDQSTFLTFLLCCKRKFPRFYAQKDLLRSLWNDLSPKRLLAMQNSEGKTAWDYWPIDWLKPRE